jgi:NAD(P)-dependent dehydrogenase (short-subunit alcohol dehydrogenase family)
MKRFDNRTVIVTGGARGMGASHARGFVTEGDGPVGRAAQVGEGDEPGTQRMRAVAGGIRVDAVHGGLHEVVDRLGVQATGQRSVALAEWAQHRAVGEGGGRRARCAGR